MTLKQMFKKFSRILTDTVYLKIKYRESIGKKLYLSNPVTFNEKLQWLKLHDRNPVYTQMVDKHEAKRIVTNLIGAQYVTPELGTWNTFDEIDFDKLPDRFVLKTTHDCGGVIICHDKSTFDYLAAKQKINAHLKKNYYYQAREWPYKNVPHRILAEEFIESKDDILVVYKVFCFNGKPYLIQTIQDDKQKNESIDYFDINWNLLDLRQNYPNSVNHLPRPEPLKEMLELSEKISQNRPFIRIDWYIVENRLLFSEYTFYSDGGFAKFHPEKWDEQLGNLIKLKE